jgi:hypothetical protein
LGTGTDLGSALRRLYIPSLPFGASPLCEEELGIRATVERIVDSWVYRIYVFLGTIALQALSFAMVGQPGSAGVWSILALYNVLGLLACSIGGGLVVGISL